MKNMFVFISKIRKDEELITNMLLLGFGLTFIVFSDNLLDSTFLNRLLGFQMLISVALIKVLIRKRRISFNYYTVTIFSCFLITPILQTFSFLWSENYLLGLYDIQLSLLLISSFILGLITTSETNSQLNSKIFYLLAGVFIVYSFYGIFQIGSVDLNGNRQTLYQITSFSGHKNLFSLFIILLLFVLSRLLLPRNRIHLRIYSVIVLIAIALLWQLATRSVFLGAIVGLIYLLILIIVKTNDALNRKLFPRGFTMLIISGTAVTVSYLVIESRIFESMVSTESAQERLKVWSSSLQLIENRWLLGYGAGNWPFIFPSNGLPEIERITDQSFVFLHAHNGFIETLLELGIGGLILLFIPFAIVLLIITREFLRSRSMLNSCSIIIWFCFLSGVFFNFPLSRPEHLVLLGFTLPYCSQSFGSKEGAFQFELNPIVRKLSVLAALSIVISLFRLSSELYSFRMQSERIKGNWRQVESLCRKAENVFYKFDNTLIPLRWYSGNANLELGNYNQAISDFHSAYDTNPYNYRVINSYAELAAQNNLELAIDLFNRSLLINPNFEPTRENLKVLHEFQSRKKNDQ